MKDYIEALAIVALGTAASHCSSSDDQTPGSRLPFSFPGQKGCQLIQSGSGPAGQENIRLETVLSGLEAPWGIAFISESDWLVTERPGRIRLVRSGALAANPVERIEVSEEGEGGLLGIAAHPQIGANRVFYIYYTVNKNGADVNRVERHRLSEDLSSASLDRVIIDDIPAGTFHNGGRLRFGPDGMLYVGTGDGRQPELAQNDASPAGKILRLRDDGSVPEDNPVPGNPLFVRGIRNTQGFDWIDSKTLIVTDHGPTGELGRFGHDEVGFASAGTNLGWPTVYGCETGPGLTPPALTWTSAVPPGGGALYTGSALPSWSGNFMMGILGAKQLQRIIIQPDGSLKNEHYFTGDSPQGFGRLREVIQSPGGELYVTTSNCDGRGTCPAEGDQILRLRAGT